MIIVHFSARECKFGCRTSGVGRRNWDFRHRWLVVDGQDSGSEV